MTMPKVKVNDTRAMLPLVVMAMAMTLQNFVAHDNDDDMYEKRGQILISRSTYILFLYRSVTGGHFRSSSSGGLGTLSLAKQEFFPIDTMSKNFEAPR